MLALSYTLQLNCLGQFVDLYGATCIASCGAHTSTVGSAPSVSCNCKAGFVPKDASNCECAPNSALRFAGDWCVSSCGSLTAAYNTALPGQVCKCVANAFIKSDESGCVATCPAGEAANLARTSCIDDSSCGSQASAENFLCVCASPTYPYVNFAKTACVGTCGTGQAASLNRTLCIADTDCGLNSVAVSKLCQCPATPNVYISLDMTQCVSSCTLIDAANKKCVVACESGEAVNLANVKCVADSACGTNTVSPVVAQKCACKPTFFINLAKSNCVASCSPNPINLANTMCMATCPSGQAVNLAATQCVLASNCGANTQINPAQLYGDACTCTAEHYIDIAETGCVAECLPDVIDINSKRCLLQCPAGQALQLSGIKCITITACGANTSVHLAPGPGAKCKCIASNYIQLDNASCVSKCLPNLIDKTATRCLTWCPAGDAARLDRVFCVANTDCGANTYPPGPGPKATCNCVALNYLDITQSTCGPDCGSGVIDFDGKMCLTTCPASQATNLAGKRCMMIIVSQLGNGCGLNTIQTLDRTKDGQICACDVNFVYNASSMLCLPTFTLTDKVTASPTCDTVWYQIEQPGNVFQCLVETDCKMFVNTYDTYGINECVAACNSTFRFQSGKQCLMQCPQYFVESPAAVFACVSACPTNKPYHVVAVGAECSTQCPGAFPFEEIGSVCSAKCSTGCYVNPSSTTRLVCTAQCTARFVLNVTNDNTKLCVTSCASPYTTQVGNQCMLPCAPPDIFVQPNLKCRNTCDSGMYVIEHQTVFRCATLAQCPVYAQEANTHGLKECMSACNATFSFQDGFQCKTSCSLFYDAVDPAFKICVSSCGLAPGKLIRNGNKCVDACPKGMITNNYACVKGANLNVPLLVGLSSAAGALVLLGVAAVLFARFIKHYRPRNSRASEQRQRRMV